MCSRCLRPSSLPRHKGWQHEHREGLQPEPLHQITWLFERNVLECRRSLLPPMETSMHGLIRMAAFVAVALIASSAWSETYIVPFWATSLGASDGEWWASSTVINPNEFPVTVTISRVFPTRTSACSSCAADASPLTIGPHSTVSLVPPSGEAGRRLVAGAFELETSGPVHIHLRAYRPGPAEIRQRLDVARDWLLPGTRSVSSVERSTAPDWRMNVFIVNPNQIDLHVSIWAAGRAENEIHATVAPGTTAVVGLPTPRCNGVPCPLGDSYPTPLLPVHVDADGVFLASVSSIGPGWAVFSLADEATIARD